MTTEQTTLMKTMRCSCKPPPPQKKASERTLILEFLLFSHFSCNTEILVLISAVRQIYLVTLTSFLFLQPAPQRRWSERGAWLCSIPTDGRRNTEVTVRVSGEPTLTLSVQSVCGVYCCLTWFLTSLQINRWVLNRATPTSSLAWYNDRKRHGVIICL